MEIRKFKKLWKPFNKLDPKVLQNTPRDEFSTKKIHFLKIFYCVII